MIEQQQQQEIDETSVAVAQANEAFALFRSRQGWDRTIDRFYSAYRGTYRTLTDYGRKLVSDLQVQQEYLDQLPDWLSPHVQVDYDALARADLNYGCEVVEGSTGLHVFERFTDPAVESTTRAAFMQQEAYNSGTQGGL